MSDDTTQGDAIKAKITGTTGPVAVGKDITQIVQTFNTPAHAPRVHVPPAARHPLFGRDDELRQTTKALREQRSVLLHGMGGIGKTALAGRAAQELNDADAFPDGILWLSEVGAASIVSICDAIARALGNEDIPALAPQDKTDPTRELLAAHDLLLALDDIALPETARAFLDRCHPPNMGPTGNQPAASPGFRKGHPTSPPRP